ncbi:MAG: sigma-70 family RNA polymerase sigma factor [Gammaproteobacteria bacterium]
MAAKPSRNEVPQPLTADELAALRAGESAAFASLVRDHHRALLAVARGMVGANDAEEIVQCAWVKAYRSIASFEGRAQPRTWLTTIVMNEARMYLRKQAREPRVHAENLDDPMGERFRAGGGWRAPPSTWSHDGPEELLMQAQFGDCLHRILEAIPAQQRLVLELRDMQGRSLDTIGRELGLSAVNVRVLLHRARQRLYQAIERFEATGQC